MQAERQVMRRDDALRILREHKAELAALQVASLRLFGSVARDEARPDSDVDLLVTFSAPVGLFHLVGVQQRLETLLGHSVDLGIEDSVKPQLRDRIYSEAISVFLASPTTNGSERSDAVHETPPPYGEDDDSQRRPPRHWKLYAEDMLECIERIQRYTLGLTEAQFERDQMRIDAVLRNFEVLGEALNQIPAEIRGRHTEVPWALMRGMRNVIVHNYVEIKLSIVWQTATEDLGPVAPLLRAVLQQEPEPA